MNKNRLEAFSDGVLAIIITIMVLEIKVPHHNSSFTALILLLPVFVSYVLSFIYIYRYLLEQPPPYDAQHDARKWQDFVGQHALVVLVITRSFRHGLDG
jgi:uncharacterized membrane protein